MTPELASLVLYADEALLAVNKPAGLPTLVDGWNPKSPFLFGLLKAECAPLWVVHRLDRDTSGVIVFARSAAAHRFLNDCFERHEAAKVYHAVVSGTPEWDATSVRLPLRADADRRHRTRVDAQLGKPAHTDFRVLRRFRQAALIEARPHTGRTHQVRAHLAAVGLPILGDALYAAAGRAADIAAPRALLHAASLRLPHPADGRTMLFEATYPPDFREIIERLSLD